MEEEKSTKFLKDAGHVLDDQLYAPKDAAGILNCSVNYLAKDRMKSAPMIPYIKLSPKFVRYRGSEIKRIMNAAQPGHQATQ